MKKYTVTAEVWHGNYHETASATAETPIAALLEACKSPLIGNYAPDASTPQFAELFTALIITGKEAHGWVNYTMTATPKRPTLASVKPVCNAELDEPLTHTPAPWSVYHVQHGVQYIGSTDCVTAATVQSSERQARDTALICAAPELLAALETLINLNDGLEDGGRGITCADWRLARAAIAKAKGNQ